MHTTSEQGNRCPLEVGQGALGALLQPAAQCIADMQLQELFDVTCGAASRVSRSALLPKSVAVQLLIWGAGTLQDFSAPASVLSRSETSWLPMTLRDAVTGVRDYMASAFGK